MSYYTIFDQAEAVVTSTTTNATLISTDAMLVHNLASGKKFQTVVGQVGALQAISTSSSTATVLPPYGLSFLQMGTAGTSATQFILADPPSKGLVKTIFMTSTTSTYNVILTQSTGAQIFSSGTALLTSNTINIQGAGSGGVTLQSISTSAWVLLGKFGTIATTLTTV